MVKPRLRGRSFLIHYGEDFVRGCEVEADARRIMTALPKRFARFGLTLHPQKTALIAFSKPSARAEGRQGKSTFEFLGFTHYWAQSRRGYWVIKRRTAKKRLRRTLTALWQWCCSHRHRKVEEQADPSQSELDSLPRLPLMLRYGQRQIAEVGLVDSGVTVNVLPYGVGVQLGAVWNERKATIRLAGNLGNFAAMPLIVTAEVGDFAQ